MRYFVSTFVLVLASASIQSDSSLLLNVMDIFKTRDSVVITGKIESGVMSNSGTLCLITTEGRKIEVSVLALSVGQKLVDTASTGASVGVQVTGVTKDDVSKGDTISESCK